MKGSDRVFSAKTKQSIRAVTTRAKSMYGVGVGFDWFTLLSMVLTFLQTNCKPKTEDARNALITDAATKCAISGEIGCIEACMSAARARKLRRKMEQRENIIGPTAQDRAFFKAVMAATAERTKAVAAMSSAYAGDETDE